jgi:hypothetical protein
MPFVNWFEFGLPRNVTLTQPRTERPSGSFRILHSPSDRSAKGSNEIEAIVESLKAKGYAIDFVTVANVPNQVVQGELAVCDLVVDQLYSDSPMPGLATEAAHFGKPTLVGGYGARSANELVRGVEFPTVFVHPDDFENDLEKLVTDPARCSAQGRKAQEFVHDQWSPQSVAGRLLQIFSGDFPEDWLIAPSSITYVHGAGSREDLSQRQVALLLDAFGPEALCLSDKPDLEAHLVKFAKSAGPRATS